MTQPKYTDWVRFHGTFDTSPDKRVSDVAFQIETNDAVATSNGTNRNPIYFTDIQFQAGGQLSGWIPNTQELMQKLEWSNDEFTYLASPHKFEGTPPKLRENIEKRWFNLLGRGAKTFVVPNYYSEDIDVPILPTGIDLTIVPKDDFDLLRVSTSQGVMLPESEQYYKRDGSIYREIEEKYNRVQGLTPSATNQDRIDRETSNWENIIKPLMDDHPLHKRYTREFFVEGGLAGEEIKIHAATRTAVKNGSELQLVGKHDINIDGNPFPIDRRKFMVAPKGTATFRIEFYKKVERTITTYEMDENYQHVQTRKTFDLLEDVGIGYIGTAGFHQWTFGKSRI